MKQHLPGEGDSRLLFFILIALLAGIFVLFRGNYLFSSMVLAGIYAISVLGLVLLIGLTGQFSLGHGAFVGLGAYASAVLSRHGVPPVLAVVLAVILTTAVATLVALPVVRLRGHLLALGTLALGLVVASVLSGWHSVTLGPSGIPDIAPIAFGPLVIRGEAANYILIWAAALLCLWGALNLWRSDFGRAALAVKRDEDAAAAMGIHVVAVKVKVFALSAAMGALSGALYAHYVTFIAPDRFHINASFELLLAALLGGSGTPYGAVAGAVLLIVLPDIVAPLRDYKVMVYGVIFIAVSLYLPKGLAGTIEYWAGFQARRRAAAKLTAQQAAKEGATT
ncbi:MAG: branched-chain amino acid ABC transporter permease [Burkholderiaceae bacterium]|nr:branched-chain amino acid ABC transporter permease [Burkholderiaceae bacterium]MDO9090145.1 branched-chain amino acid ABC transporter permease [Burkholderiaceae bacterium]